MKNSILAFTLLLSSIIIADMIYDPVLDIIYSSNSKINQNQYRLLLACCIELDQKLRVQGIVGQQNFDQVLDMLKRIDTAESIQLMKDLKKKKIFFPDGSLYRDIIV